MKIVYIMLGLFICFLSQSFPQENNILNVDALNANIPLFVQLDLLSELNHFKTEKEINEMAEISKGLNPFYKDILYKRYSKNPWKAAILNLFTGGMGSILEGDLLSGIPIQIGMLASYSFGVIGISTMDPNRQKRYFLISEIGSIVFGIAGVVMPFIEDIPYNKKLKRAYSLNEQ